MKYILPSIICVCILLSCDASMQSRHSYYTTEKARNTRSAEAQKQALLEEKERKARMLKIATDTYEKLATLTRTQQCPLIYIESSVECNSIGTPMAIISFINMDKKSVTAIELDFTCHNAFGEPVSRYGFQSHRFRGIAQQMISTNGENGIPSKEGYVASWTLYGHNNTTNIRTIRVTRIMYQDGTQWRYRQRYKIVPPPAPDDIL